MNRFLTVPKIMTVFACTCILKYFDRMANINKGNSGLPLFKSHQLIERKKILVTNWVYIYIHKVRYAYDQTVSLYQYSLY